MISVEGGADEATIKMGQETLFTGRRLSDATFWSWKNGDLADAQFKEELGDNVPGIAPIFRTDAPETVAAITVENLAGHQAAEDVKDRNGKILLAAGRVISAEAVASFHSGGVTEVNIFRLVPDAFLLTTPGGTKPIKLTGALLDQLIQMVNVISRPKLSSTVVALTGHKSTGKNTAVYVLAGLLRQPVRTISFNASTGPNDIRTRVVVGKTEKGTTDEVRAEYYDIVEHDDWALGDEAASISKQSTFTCLNTINTVRQDADTKAGPHFRAFFAWNWAGAIYGGRRMDAGNGPFVSRVGGEVHFGWAEPEDALQENRLVHRGHILEWSLWRVDVSNVELDSVLLLLHP